MFDRITALDGPYELLAWISLANVVIGLATAIIIATIKSPPRLSSSLAFLTAFVLIYGRSFYRGLTDAPVTYAGAPLHAALSLACVWGAVQAIRWQRQSTRDDVAGVAHEAALEAERVARKLLIAADALRTRALQQTADNTARTASATERMANQERAPERAADEASSLDRTAVATERTAASTEELARIAQEGNGQA